MRHGVGGWVRGVDRGARVIVMENEAVEDDLVRDVTDWTCFQGLALRISSIVTNILNGFDGNERNPMDA